MKYAMMLRAGAKNKWKEEAMQVDMVSEVAQYMTEAQFQEAVINIMKGMGKGGKGRKEGK